jgi:glycosyltransferase involved in cell wall biosynthesis
MTAPYLSVVLPCRDQADHIERVLASYAEPLQAVSGGYELVVVPNACRDATPEIVAALAARDPRMRIVDNPEGGWGLSVLTGLAAARGRMLCYTNTARTDPRQVPALLAAAERAGGCIAKVRRVHRGAAVREIGSWLYNLEARIVLGIHAGDVNGTPKIFPRGVYDRLALESVGDLLDLELLAKARRLAVPVVEMPVEGFARHGGRSRTGLTSAWRMYSGAFRLRRTLAGFAPPPR